ncbi:MAG: outer membrane beta-barrel domain-containing protein [Gammaproteobacteria bacterium]
MYGTKNGLFLALLAGIFSSQTMAQQTSGSDELYDPEPERRTIDVDAIESEDFEVTAFLGWMSVEDFESDPVYGIRLAYHINPHVFLEATYGESEAGTSSADRVSSSDLLDNDDYKYYDASIGYNLLSETFVSTERTWNSAIYVIGGVGNTELGDEDEFTVNLGFGVRVLPKDNVSVRLEARDYIFDTDASGKDKTTHNFQVTLNLGWYF